MPHLTTSRSYVKKVDLSQVLAQDFTSFSISPILFPINMFLKI